MNYAQNMTFYSPFIHICLQSSRQQKEGIFFSDN